MWRNLWYNFLLWGELKDEKKFLFQPLCIFYPDICICYISIWGKPFSKPFLLKWHNLKTTYCYKNMKMAWSDGKTWLTLDDVKMVIKTILETKFIVKRQLEEGRLMFLLIGESAELIMNRLKNCSSYFLLQVKASWKEKSVWKMIFFQSFSFSFSF